MKYENFMLVSFIGRPNWRVEDFVQIDKTVLYYARSSNPQRAPWIIKHFGMETLVQYK